MKNSVERSCASKGEKKLRHLLDLKKNELSKNRQNTKM